MSMTAGPSAPPPGSGEPPSNHELDRRLTVLGARFDTILPTLATKQDLHEFRAELLQMFADQKAYFQNDMQKPRAELFKAFNDAMRSMMALMLTLFIGTFAIDFAMWNT